MSSKKSSELSREKKPKGRLSPVLREPRKKSLIKEEIKKERKASVEKKERKRSIPKRKRSIISSGSD